MSTALDSEETYQRLIRGLTNPDEQSNVDDLLSELGLNGLPSREQVYAEIEEEILRPKNTLPNHWLPTYQV